MPGPEPDVAETSQGPINRLADVLANLQNKPQSKTNRPIATTPITFDCKSENFELFEDLFHTMNTSLKSPKKMKAATRMKMIAVRVK